MINNMEIRLATYNDDEAIRRLISSIPLKGMLKIRYSREPSFFSSIELQGVPQQTIVGVKDDMIMAVGSRNLQRVYMNRIPETAGYISNLRFLPGARHGISLIRGISFLEELPVSRNVGFHYATLVDDDSLNRKIFASGRPGMPKSYDRGRLNTFAIPLGKVRITSGKGESFEVVRADRHMTDDILAFLKKEGCKRDLFPVTGPEDYPFNNFKPEDFYIALERGSIAGVCSVNDLQSVKQYVIEDYSFRFGLIRFFLNRYLGLRNMYSVPGRKDQVRLAFIGFPLVRDNRPDIFRSLISRIYKDFSGTGYRFLTLTLHQMDPLNNSLNHLPKINYTSRLYYFKLAYDSFALHENNDTAGIPFVDILRL
ncbi:MAG: hypothetical protein R6U58_06165 [Bacteroidales bacterium]